MNIILIGFMGSGKSSLAELLSRKMHHKHIETDELVLAISKRKSIKDIFSLDGELQFRELEIKVAKKMSNINNCIISTGGGMVMNKICIDYLKKQGKVIYLETSFEEIERRLKDDDTRPLFSDKKRARELFMFRENLYSKYADIIVSTDGKSLEEVTNCIIKIL